jgi:hypothetical protein
MQVDIKWRDNYGNPRQEIYQLSPGWYTLVLGSDVKSIPVQ